MNFSHEWSLRMPPSTKSLPMMLSLLLSATIATVCSCGGGTTSSQSSNPTQPTYPSTPPVPITWSPQTSPLPAPPAQVPPPSGSSDFPLTISNPLNGGTVD